MLQISSAITQHTIVLCIEKRERGIAVQQTLNQAGYKVVIALSLYDALKCIAQEMPHLVISEVTLSDGTAATLFDRLQQHEMLRRTPVMVHVIKKTKEELAPLASRKFVGFFLGPFEPKGFLSKVQEIIRAHSSVSPYFVEADSIGIKSDMTISIDAAVMGRSGEQLVSRSGTEVDPAASMVCVPTSADLSPVVFKMATNLRSGEEIFNMFPLNRIVGAGRKWVLTLPEIQVGGPDKQEKMHKVVFYEPNEARYEGFREIMRGYNIDLVHAKSVAMATSLVKRDFTAISGVYLHELTTDASSIEWKQVYAKLPLNQRPSLLVGTTSLNARSTSEIRYIKRPFGMGLFVEMLQASFEKGSQIAQMAGKNAATNAAGVPVRYQAPATLIGLDETGGILQLRFPLLKGSRINIAHAFLQTAWEGSTQVQVTGSAVTAAKADIWHARFEVVNAGMSKVKYWEKLAKHLSTLPPPAAAAAAVPAAAPAA